MAYNFALPRQRPQVPQQPNAQPNVYGLQRQAPLTQGAQIAQDQNTQGLQTGQFADVQSAQGATDRANALRTSGALQATRGTFARSGADTSPEAATRAQDQSFSAAEGQNLNGTNAVNQLQRQYRSDAMTNANGYEAAAQTGAKDNRDYLTNRDDAAYSRATNERGNQQQQAQLGVSNDLAYKGQATNQYNAETNRTGTEGNLAIGNRNAATGETNAATAATDVSNKFALGHGGLANDATKIGNDYTIGMGNLAVNQASQGTNQYNAETNRTTGYGDLAVKQAAQGTNQQNADTTALDVGNRFTLGGGTLDNEINRTNNDLTIGQGNLAIGKQNADTNALSVNNEDSRFKLTRGDANAQTAVENKRIDAGTNYNHIMDQINSIADPKAKQAAYNIYMNGGDVSQFITGALYDSAGGLKGGSESPYASASPATQDVKTEIDKLKAIDPMKGPDEKGWSPETPEQYNNRITAKAYANLQQASNVSNGPLNTATKTASDAQAAARLANGTPQQADFDTLKSIPAGAAPVGAGAVQDFLKNSTTGGWTKIDGKAYKVVNSQQLRTGHNDSGGYTHTDYTVLQDQNGGQAYLDPTSGKVVNKPLNNDNGFFGG